ncbi:MAG: hypothetical protein U0J35_04690 [Ruminococcus sp.]|nr:hypothetical protein [Ruminococcus sp.]MEE0005943.1 hypothetical protein [Ruminococcus sp.]
MNRVDCVENDQPTQIAVVYFEKPTEYIDNVQKIYINDKTYVISRTRGTIILSLSSVERIEIK